MEILVGALAAWGLLMLLWTIYGALMLPLSRNIPMVVLLRCRGRAPWLEFSVRAVLWLREVGVLSWEILLLDEGMDEEARDVANRLMAEDRRVTLLDISDLLDWMEDTNDAK